MNKEQIVTVETLLEFLALYGGKIVSTASLKPEWIEQARASGRMYVGSDSLGFVWEPNIDKFPETVEEIDFLERWYPLQVELSEKLKNPSLLFEKKNRRPSSLLPSTVSAEEIWDAHSELVGTNVSDLDFMSAMKEYAEAYARNLVANNKNSSHE